MSNELELSKMFHEIKNPLALIGSSLQLIESEHPEVREFRFWNQTMKDLQNLRLLIDELSSFQKSSHLTCQCINLFDFVEDIAESVEGFLLEKDTPLKITSDIFDLDFEGDEQKLRIALINLIKNASESSKSGSPIELLLSQDASTLHMSVKDYGHGISEELLPSIFEPFTTTKSYGTGLGLPIVKKTIESHDGTISIQSAEGAGTTITIHLPLPKEKSTNC